MQRLTCHGWQGNARELENVIERAVILSRGEEIDVGDLPPEVGNSPSVAVQEVDAGSLAHLPYAEARRLAVRAFERRYLGNLLNRHEGNIAAAARAAQVDRSNFRRLLKQYGVPLPSNAQPSMEDDVLEVPQTPTQTLASSEIN
jgi:two-component system response regulator HydG